MPPEPQEPKFCIRPMQSASFVDRLGEFGTGAESGVAACPVCGGKLIEIRGKIPVCSLPSDLRDMLRRRTRLSLDGFSTWGLDSSF